MGVVDSGVGGLSIYEEIVRLLPQGNLLYLADQTHVPYGPRSLEQIREFSVKITRFLVKQGIKIIVIACNTMSAASLYYLRKQFPDIFFVGMEPALKPSIEKTRSGSIGVIATQATFQGKPYENLIKKYAHNVEVIHQPCPGLVEQVEAGKVNTPEIRFLLQQYLQPMIEKKIDQLVLGCTHYLFLKPVIKEIVGDKISLIDPALPVARQAVSVLNQYRNEKGLTGSAEGDKHLFFTSGNRETFTGQIIRYLPLMKDKHFQVRGFEWEGGSIIDK